MNILFIGGADIIGSSLGKQFLTNEKYQIFEKKERRVAA